MHVMTKVTTALMVLLLFGATTTARTQNIPVLAAGAERVVAAAVSSVEAREVVNEFGDQLILSQATLVVEEVLRGEAVGRITLHVEGGTLGGITMHVSDLPLLEPGDRGVFFVGRTASGLAVPHKRGQGILKLDDDDLVEGTNLSLAEIRAQVLQ